MWSSGAWDHIHRAGPASALIHSSYCPHINTDCSNGGQTAPSFYNGEERGSGAIYDPRDNVSDRVVPVHAETGDVGIWWPSVTSGDTKLLYGFTYTTDT